MEEPGPRPLRIPVLPVVLVTGGIALAVFLGLTRSGWRPWRSPAPDPVLPVETPAALLGPRELREIDVLLADAHRLEQGGLELEALPHYLEILIVDPGHPVARERSGEIREDYLALARRQILRGAWEPARHTIETLERLYVGDPEIAKLGAMVEEARPASRAAP